MPLFDFHCSFCGKTFEEESNSPNDGALCSCGNTAQIVWRKMPCVNFNGWVPDYREMNGEKEAIAAGMYE